MRWNKFLYKMFKTDKTHWWYIFLFLIIASWSTFANRVANGYIIAGGDIPFIPNIQDVFGHFFFTWSNFVNAAGYNNLNIPALPFYSLSYLLSWSGIENHNILNITYFIFIFSSFLSAYFGFKIMLKDQISAKWLFVVGFFYAFNSFTIYAFSSTWGYNFFLSLYPFIPLIFGLFLEGIRTENRKYLYYSVIFVIIASGSFANFAFLLSFFIISFIFLLCLYHFLNKERLTVKKVNLIIFYYVLILLLFLSVIVLNYFSSQLMTGMSIHFADWMKNESMTFLDALSLFAPGKDAYFPFDFPYSFGTLSYIYKALSLYPVAFVAILIGIVAKEEDRKKYIFIFASIFLVGMLVSKMMFPFYSINHLIFSFPVMKVLRSFQKFGIFMPFFMTIVLAVIYSKLYLIKKSLLEKIILALTLVIFIYPLPFYFGKYQANISPNHDPNFSYLVQIPYDYYQASEYLNNKEISGNIMYLPLGDHQVGIGWVNYPKWKYFGSNVTSYLFQDPIFSPIDNLMGISFGRVLEDQKFYDYGWFRKMLNLYSVKYIIFDENVQLKNVDHLFFDSLIQQGVISLDKELSSLKIYKVSNINNSEFIRTTGNVYQLNNADVNNNENFVIKTLSFLNSYEGDFYVPQNNYRDYKNNFIQVINSEDGSFSIRQSGKYKIFSSDKTGLTDYQIYQGGELYSIDSNSGDQSLENVSLRKGFYRIAANSEKTNDTLDFRILKVIDNIIIQDRKDLQFNTDTAKISTQTEGTPYYFLIISNVLPKNGYTLKLFLDNDSTIKYHATYDESTYLKDKLHLLQQADSNNKTMEIEMFTNEFSDSLFVFLVPEDEYLDNIGSLIKGFSVKGNFNLNPIIARTEDLNQPNDLVDIKNVNKKNPTIYTADISDIKDNFLIVFNQQFNDNWELSFTNGKDYYKPDPKSHFKIDNAFNGWDIDGKILKEKLSQDNLKITIYYKVQNYFFYSVIVSAFALIIMVTDLSFILKNEKE